MKKEKMNDKGFSLVELIIVIAIMAVLVVVLAPQYLKYVERSRNSTDLQNATEIVTALQVYGSDPEATVSIPTDPTEKFSIKIDKSGTVGLGKTSFQGAALIDAGLADADGNLKMKCQSKTLWDNYTITATPSNGGLVFTYSSAVGDTTNTNFQTKMEGNTTETSK